MRTFVVRASGVAYAAAVIGTLAASALHAQRGGAPDFSKEEAKATKVAGNVYMIRTEGPDFYPAPGGRPVGTVGALVGPDGVLMVDASFAPMHDKIVAAIRQITDSPIRYLVNTHVHPDHTDGNEGFGKTGVIIMARDTVRARMVKPANGNPAPPLALPSVTYDQPMTIHMNGEDVRLIPVIAGHTDGDTVVQFPIADVIMCGDLYRADNSYPNIDRANGGSLTGIINGLNVVINLAGPNTKIVQGHGPVGDKASVIAHRDMIIAIRDKVSALVQQGKTQEEVLTAKPTSEFDNRGPQPLVNADRFVTQLYQELKAAR